MRELIIFMASRGPNILTSRTTEAIDSIMNNIGIEDYAFYFVFDNEDYMNHFVSYVPPEHIEKAVMSQGTTWAQIFNQFFDEYCMTDKSRYILVSHDDVIAMTKNFYPMTMEEISGYEDQIGWITYSSIGYFHQDKRTSNSVRAGFFKDRGKFPSIFEFHSDILDYPTRAVRTFGPFTHFNLVKTSALKEIGKCEDWTVGGVLTDEDWSLESLIKGYYNVWVPTVHYFHPNKPTRRIYDTLSDAPQAHEGFRNKWGFDTPIPYQEADKLIEKYPHLADYAHKNSYDWMYLK